MKKLLWLFPMVALLASCCGNAPKNKPVLTPVMEKALNDKGSKFYADFASFPKQQSELPIGVFDSGTGGLTVLEVLLNTDMVDNATGEAKPDGVLDFVNEDFIAAEISPV